MRTLAFVTEMKNQLSSFAVSREGPSSTNLLTFFMLVANAIVFSCMLDIYPLKFQMLQNIPV